MEADVAFTTLLQRTREIRMLVDEPEWRNIWRFRGLRSLPIAFVAG
jgi:hypothetical protein